MNPLNNHLSEQDEQRLGVVHENLEGWVPTLATESEFHEAIEKAFDYRGDMTLTLKDGRVVVGYLFDRKIGGPHLTDCFIRVMPKDSSEKLKILYSEIAGIAFTGRDTAAGKSFAAWVKKYNEKKAAGETNIGIEAESLDD
ncbi:MAG: hypothetical protein ABSC71_19040 [Candidatus Acidiferrales bacterium]|jgi:hypothetical protein